MRYGHIPGIEKQVSRIGQGTVMVREENLDYGFELLDEIFKLGCNTFDTGRIYGNEDTVGKWVRERGLREEVVIIGKGAHHNEFRRRVTPKDIEEDLLGSLESFGFDYLDLYLLHRDDPSVPIGPIVEVLNKHHKAGRIKAFGGSNWSYERIKEANDYAEENGLVPFAVSSPHFSLAEQMNEPWAGCHSLTGRGKQVERDLYAESQFPTIPWSSLCGGFFSGRIRRDNVDDPGDARAKLCVYCYASDDNFKRLDRANELAQEKGLTAAQIALAWVLHQPMNLFPLVGCRTVAEFVENAKALDVELTSQEISWLDLRSENR